MTLFRRTARALQWSILSTYVNMALQFIIGLVLARILVPEDFGLIGMTFVFVALATTFVDSGFLQALIQKKQPDRDDYSVVFKFNLIASILLSTIIFLLAESIAGFYNQPGVAGITKVLSVMVFIESLSLVQKASLQKELKFEVRAKVEIIAITVSGSIGIILALRGFGVWSLVVRMLLLSLMTTTLFWVFNPITINFRVRWNKMVPLLRFGGKVFLADQVESVSSQIAQMIIGKRYTARDLGLYTKAVQYQTILSNTAIISVNKVIFPSFSMVQDENLRLKQAYRTLMKLTLLGLIPFMLICILIAEEMVSVIIGDKWLEMVPYFQVLCLSAIFYPFTIFNLNIIKVKGKANLYFRLALISKGILIPAIIIGIQFGIMGLVIALLVQRIIAAIINSRYSGRLVDYSLWKQLSDVGFYVVISALLYSLILWLKKTILLDIFSDLAIGLIIPVLMVTLYVASLFLVRHQDILLLRNLVKKLKNSSDEE